MGWSHPEECLVWPTTSAFKNEETSCINSFVICLNSMKIWQFVVPVTRLWPLQAQFLYLLLSGLLYVSPFPTSSVDSFKKSFLFYVYERFVCMYVWTPCVYDCHWKSEEVSDPLKLKLQTIVSCIWVLGIEPWSSIWAKSANCLSSSKSNLFCSVLVCFLPCSLFFFLVCLRQRFTV